MTVVFFVIALRLYRNVAPPQPAPRGCEELVALDLPRPGAWIRDAAESTDPLRR
jgi:hypothetical protein